MLTYSTRLNETGEKFSMVNCVCLYLYRVMIGFLLYIIRPRLMFTKKILARTLLTSFTCTHNKVQAIELVQH